MPLCAVNAPSICSSASVRDAAANTNSDPSRGLPGAAAWLSGAGAWPAGGAGVPGAASELKSASMAATALVQPLTFCLLSLAITSLLR